MTRQYGTRVASRTCVATAVRAEFHEPGALANAVLLDLGAAALLEEGFTNPNSSARSSGIAGSRDAGCG
jgi:hypothetical protein